LISQHSINDLRGSQIGSLLRLTASKEIILSAGSVGSPHILLNSGIGNAQTLTALGVKSIVNLPDVGQNLSDHTFLGNPWLANGTDTFEVINRDPNARAQAIQQWQTNGTGPLVDTVVDHIGFLRVPNTNPIFQDTPDPSSGPKTPHYEMLVSVCLFTNYI
jgi:choline dehydrogenase-like flavoprotein